MDGDYFNWYLCIHAFFSYTYSIMTVMSGLFMNLLPYDCQSVSSSSSSITNISSLAIELLDGSNDSSSSSSSDWESQGFVSGLSPQYGLCYRPSGELTSVIFFAGAVVGSLSVGAFADNFGRVASMCLGLTVSSLCHLLAAWAPQFWLHLAARCINGISVMFCLTSTAVYGCEASSVKMRAKFFAWFGLGGAAGLLVSPIPALLTRQHQHFQAALAACSICPLLLSLLLPESARWLAATGRTEAAARSKARIDKINSGHLLTQCCGADEPQSDRLHHLQLQKQQQQQQQQHNEKNLSLLMSIKKLVRNKQLLLRGLMIGFYSLSIAMNFYGFYFIVAKAVTNLYVYILLLGASQLPYPLVFNLVSRRSALIIAGLGAAASSLGIAGVVLVCPDFSESWLLSGLNICLGFVGSFFATIGFNVIVIVSTETFPTSVRNCCAGACAALLRLGCMLAPTAAFIPSLSLQLLLLSLPLLAACACVLPLPDTRSEELTDGFADDFASCQHLGSSPSIANQFVLSMHDVAGNAVTVWSCSHASLDLGCPARVKDSDSSLANANADADADANADADADADTDTDANANANANSDTDANASSNTTANANTTANDNANSDVNG